MTAVCVRNWSDMSAAIDDGRLVVTLESRDAAGDPVEQDLVVSGDQVADLFDLRPLDEPVDALLVTGRQVERLTRIAGRPVVSDGFTVVSIWSRSA